MSEGEEEEEEMSQMVDHNDVNIIDDGLEDEEEDGEEVAGRVRGDCKRRDGGGLGGVIG